MSFHYYEPLVNCTGMAQQGTKNLRDAVASWPDANTGYPYGIYNCRPPSLHGEGRALDIGFPGVAHPSGTALVEVLVANAGALGLMGVIWNKTRWSARSPNGAPYTGPSPHTDHIHVEVNWDKARDNPLTTEEIEDIIYPPLELPMTEFYIELEKLITESGGNARSLFYTLELLRGLAEGTSIPANAPKAVAAAVLSPTHTY